MKKFLRKYETYLVNLLLVVSDILFFKESDGDTLVINIGQHNVFTAGEL